MLLPLRVCGGEGGRWATWAVEKCHHESRAQALACMLGACYSLLVVGAHGLLVQARYRVAPLAQPAARVVGPVESLPWSASALADL